LKDFLALQQFIAQIANFNVAQRQIFEKNKAVASKKIKFFAFLKSWLTSFWAKAALQTTPQFW
jgi:hypothetical protein